MADMSVNQRAQQVLKILVERYIQDGYPIGSKTLAEEYPLGLSSASIRNILADLEEAGYLTSPHTSAGRIPTSLGYRYFVNELLTAKPTENMRFEELELLNSGSDMSHLLQSASTLLSSLTQMAGVVALPKRNRIELKQVEFLPLSANRILVILVLNNHEVQNRIVYTDKIYSQSELQQVSNYLNAHYAGKELLAIRQALSVALRHDHDDMTRLLQTVMEVANKAFSEDLQNKDYVIAGQNNLLNYSREANLEQVKALFDANDAKTRNIEFI